MQQDQIQYSVHPVFSYEDVYKKTNEDNVSDRLRSLVMIDCGGLVDWTTPRSYNLYIFDSHHPINHNNIHCGQGVHVIDDGTLPPLDQVPLDEDLWADEAEEAHDPNEEY